MYLRGWLVLVIGLGLVAISGCKKAAAGKGGEEGVNVAVLISIPAKWVDEAISRIVGWVEDGTGIEIEKGDVKIESLGARKEPNGYAHISDFKVTVNYRKTEFTSTPKDIPCSEAGIPNDEGEQRIKEAVEEIKQRIRAIR